MSEQAKTLVPKLRFPEFQHAADWGQSKLIELAKRVTAKNKDGTVIRVLTNSAADGIVDQRDYFDKDIATQGNLEGYYIVDNGDYVYNPRVSNLAPVGPISKNKLGTGVMSPLYSVFRFKNIENSFYEQYFKTPYWHNYLRTISNSGARHDRMAITTDDFMDMPLPVPNPKEQQKIADCLTSIDELITAQTKKIAALKDHKKGLMQQLFPAEGETVPKLRFPEFKFVGEWEEKPIKDVFSIFQGFAFSSFDAVNKGVRWLKIADVSFQQMNHQAPSYLPVEHKEKYNKFSVKLGDYIMALTRPILSKQLKIAPVDMKFHGALLNQRVGKLESNHNLTFVYYLLQTTKLIEEIENSISGSEPPNLSVQQIEDIKVYIPLEKDEQQKIADCLSSIDELTTAQTQKLEALKAHKKGLMQQLFPAMDEVVE
jgi:type I restriction enzyme S subunit